MSALCCVLQCLQTSTASLEQTTEPCSTLHPSPAGPDPTENLSLGNISQPGLFPKEKPFSSPWSTGNTLQLPREGAGLARVHNGIRRGGNKPGHPPVCACV